MRTKRFLAGTDVDLDAVATSLRRLSDGLESRDVNLTGATAGQNVDAPEETAEFTIELTYTATHGYADVADAIRFATRSYLRFNDRYRDKVMDGTHRTTVRYDLERHFEPGERIALVDEAGDTFAEADVEAMADLPIGMVSELDIPDYGDMSPGDLAGLLRRLYGDSSIKTDSTVTVVMLGRIDVAGDYGGDA